MVERRIAVQREELMLAERELAEMTEALRGAPADVAGDSVRDAWRDLESAGGVRPETDVRDELVQLEIDQARRKAAVDEQLAFLKKKMGRFTVHCSLFTLLSATRSPAQQPIVARHLRSRPHSTAPSPGTRHRDLGGGRVEVPQRVESFPGPGGRGSRCHPEPEQHGLGAVGLELIEGATAEEAMRTMRSNDAGITGRHGGRTRQCGTFTGTGPRPGPAVGGQAGTPAYWAGVW